MAGDEVRAALRRTAHRTLDATLARAVASAGDTLSVAVPLPAAVTVGGLDRVVLEALREVGEDRGYAVSYTTGATSALLSRSNMPATGRRVNLPAVDPPEASSPAIGEDIFDLLALLVRQGQIDRSEVIAALALLVAVLSFLRDLIAS